MPKTNDTSPAGRMARKMELLMERYESGELIEDADQPVRVTLIVPPAIAAVVSEFVDFYAD